MDKIEIQDGDDLFQVGLSTDLVSTVSRHGPVACMELASGLESHLGPVSTCTARFERATGRGINAGNVLFLFDSIRAEGNAVSVAPGSLVLRRMKRCGLPQPVRSGCGSRPVREFLGKLASNPRVRARSTGGSGSRKT